MILLGWEQRSVDIVVPNSTAWGMFDLARKLDVDAGGRFDVYGSRAIVLWSAGLGANGTREQPVGVITVRWRTPTKDETMICRLAWDPEVSTEDEVRQALALLIGGAAPHAC